jgi:hypothetical protein
LSDIANETKAIDKRNLESREQRNSLPDITTTPTKEENNENYFPNVAIRPSHSIENINTLTPPPKPIRNSTPITKSNLSPPALPPKKIQSTNIDCVDNFYDFTHKEDNLNISNADSFNDSFVMHNKTFFDDFEVTKSSSSIERNVKQVSLFEQTLSKDDNEIFSFAQINASQHHEQEHELHIRNPSSTTSSSSLVFSKVRNESYTEANSFVRNTWSEGNTNFEEEKPPLPVKNKISFIFKF